MYPLFRVLNDFRPQNILELGLGQTTKMICQYASSFDADHTVVEHDASWLSTFANVFDIPENTEVCLLDLVNRAYEDDENIIAYKTFKKTFGNRKFDFICIDGPFGYSAIKYARVDILDILPGSLESSFVIMIDDTNRAGERATIEAIHRVLQANNIGFTQGEYNGIKGATLITSDDNKFLISL
jgi:hypothetical protein